MKGLRKPFGVVAAAAFGICVAVRAGDCPAVGQQRAGGAATGARALFLEKCSGCHEAGVAYDVMSRRLEWMRTVAAMAVKEGASMDREDVKNILAYRSYCRAHARTVFSSLCGRCHDFDELQGTGRSARQWRTLITYMAQRQDFQVKNEERDLMAAFLQE